MANDSADRADPNQHVREYLRYYLQLSHPPYYAVLLDGPWGIGKTYLVKALLEELLPQQEKPSYVYVSLYGLGSTDDIDTALLYALYPILSGRVANLTGRLVKAALRYGGVDHDVGIRDILNTDADRVYVFDDLERSGLPTNEALGYINEFVEHMGRKVIVIANEDEITNRESYRTRREKMVGKTLRARSSFQSAFDHFVEAVEDDAIRRVLTESRAEIGYIYHASETDNLRILQQTIWDAERLLKCLDANLLENRRGMGELIRFFFAFSFEVKAGRIGEKDLRTRSQKLGYYGWFDETDENNDPLLIAAKRYSEAHLGDPLLSDELLVETLVEGVIDCKRLQGAIETSSPFVQTRDEPPWRTVWYGWERSEDEFYKALDRLRSQFADREVTVIGEVAHVLGLWLWLAEIGELDVDVTEAAEQGRAYIDDLYRNGNIEPDIGGDAEHVRAEGWGGLGIRSSDKPEYVELFNYLLEKRAQATRDAFPGQAAQLLEDMRTDADLFHRRITVNNTEDSVFARVPVFSVADPSTFVEVLLSLHPNDQRTVLSGLKSRYEHGQLAEELVSEREWFDGVCEKLEGAIRTLRPLARERLSSSLKVLRTSALRRLGEAKSRGA